MLRIINDNSLLYKWKKNESVIPFVGLLCIEPTTYSVFSILDLLFVSMKRLLLLLILIPLFSVGQNAKEIAKKCMSSTVSITMKDKYMQPISLGSGFILESGKVVTNLHVIEGARNGNVTIPGNSQSHNIQGYYSIDKINDLAILSVPTIGSNSLELCDDNNQEIGQKIYAIGNPQGLGGTISEGIISAIRESNSLIQITAPISPGSSGGPVINNEGKVVGVAVSTISSGQNLNFAIPSFKIKALKNKTPNEVKKLNLGEKIVANKTSSSEIDISQAVEITNLTKGSFSIRNLTPYYIGNIKVFIVCLDSKGLPVDYIELDILNEVSDYKLLIKPFLAKKFDMISTNHGSTLSEMVEYYEFGIANWGNGNKYAYRILDFEIHSQ